jgi:3-oxoadipate enol-lactonase
MPWTEANGAALRYVLEGSGTDTLVLIHEAGGSLESWDAVVSLLAPRYRLLRYDQRGFGMSERAPQLSVQGMVADLHALLAALALDAQPAHLVGTAIGGTIAIAMAAMHPGGVHSLVATSPVMGNIPAAGMASLEQRAQLVEREGMRAVADTALARSYPAALRGDDGRFAAYRARFLANDPQSFAALSRSYSGIDLERLYPAIHCPTLIVGCTHDQIKPPAECVAAAAAIPKGRYRELPSGHFLAVQAPQLLAQAVRDFHDGTA